MKSYYTATILLSTLSLGVHTATNGSQPNSFGGISLTKEAYDVTTGERVLLNRRGDLLVFDRSGNLVKTLPLGVPINKVESISLQGNQATLRYGNGMIGEDVIDLSMA